MKRRFYRTLSGRCILILSALIIFLGISICTFSYITFKRNLESTMLQESETTIQFLGDKINTDTNYITHYSRTCCANTDIVNYLFTTKESPRYNHITSSAVRILNNEYDNNAAKQYIQRSIIGSFLKDDYLQEVSANHSVDRPMSTLVKQLPYFYNYINNKPMSDYDYEVHDTTFPYATKQMIPLIQVIPFPYDNNYLGFMYNEISISLFTDAIHSYTDPDKTVYITIGEQTFSTDSVHPNELTPIKIDHANEISVDHTFVFSDTKVSNIYDENGKHKIVTRPLSMNNCSISVELSPIAFHQLFQKYITMMVFIISIILVAGFVCITFMTRFLMIPINEINHHIREISAGHFEPNKTIEWDNEIGDIGRIINHMGTNIDSLMKKRLEDECEKKNYEYKMLQSQINPHFIYNTLNSIKWMAIVQHADGISEMTTALSRLMKNISKGRNSIVSVDNEIHLLDDYVTIQRYRYGGAIKLEYQIDEPDIRNNKILRFTLQPVVENAIFHGIEPKGVDGLITIHMFYPDSDQLQIDVTDNGIGLSPELIEQVLNDNNTNQSSFFKSIGIAGVNKMIQYTFGEAYGMHIESKVNEYTTVSIHLPKCFVEGSLEHNETTNC